MNEQGSEAWLEERKGKLTASVAASAIGLCPYKSKQKLWREIMGMEAPFTGNEATRWGEEHEPDAAFDYEVHTGLSLVETGFWPHPQYDWIGASPDRLVVSVPGLVEIKCRFDETLWEAVPDHYMAQMQVQLEVTRRLWCDFVSWTPDEIAVFRVPRSDEAWDVIFPRLKTFWKNVKEMEEPRRSKKPQLPEINIERII